MINKKRKPTRIKVKATKHLEIRPFVQTNLKVNKVSNNKCVLLYIYFYHLV